MKFGSNYIKLLFAIAIMVLAFNYASASPNNFYEFQESSGEEPQILNLPDNPFLQDGDLKIIVKNLKHYCGNRKIVLFLSNFPLEKWYFKTILPQNQDLQYLLNIQIFPSHYFW